MLLLKGTLSVTISTKRQRSSSPTKEDGQCDKSPSCRRPRSIAVTYVRRDSTALVRRELLSRATAKRGRSRRAESVGYLEFLSLSRSRRDDDGSRTFGRCTSYAEEWVRRFVTKRSSMKILNCNYAFVGFSNAAQGYVDVTRVA
ncbi:hypothetical protein EVAR_7298_1 [Eumeta japonica]|uniref:Uncharacterized protein n=1 Tax=Eumeta variegata TaxID=151549 RepID=A0A4C1T569_EUMVA|nr:hypothetical protein EVAR_7298_1 [Eumeta japonica]